MRVLLVEDDERLAMNLALALRESGFAVDVVETGRQALEEAGVFPYDVIVLDLQLPDIGGMEVCRQLRERGTATRVLMATARDAVTDRVEGLETGADDYLVKPYTVEELTARIRALLRRPAGIVPTRLDVEDLSLDTGTRVAHRGGRDISLTTKEFAVLEYLMRNPGRVVTRENISDHAWDANYDPFSNIIDVYIARLRRKVDGEGEEPLIETIRGAGYRLGPPEASRA